MGKFSYVMSCGKAINYFGTYGGHINVFWIKWTFPIKLWKNHTHVFFDSWSEGSWSSKWSRCPEYSTVCILLDLLLWWTEVAVCSTTASSGALPGPTCFWAMIKDCLDKAAATEEDSTVSLVWFAWPFQSEPTHPPPPLLQPLHGLRWVSDSWAFLATVLWRGLLIY